ncbi:hypothetical protein [Kineobactrum salinum]|uniref:Uncharacterized protein n=1 Tax=Kineobactrum salinum TaxID=2708301 RepID=A0A6C0U4V9_9GAMM|nr:hypothetical protein [Kineobactrum salinum]QIB67192.1 hypothetical protein G3T16_19050 [Kineobactrum salinum]
MNLTLAIQVAKFVIWLMLNLSDLVLEAEENLPEAGRGGEKFAAVKEAVLVAARVLGLADRAIDAALGVVDVDKRINDTVSKEINAAR